jgi:hypothetical protein
MPIKDLLTSYSFTATPSSRPAFQAVSSIRNHTDTLLHCPYKV